MSNLKDYADKYRCLQCNTPIIFNTKIVDEHSKFIPLDLNHKRHVRSGVECILHEEKVVKKIQRILKKANDIELTSFQLRLAM